MNNNKATKPKLIHGVGINDADYTISARVNGKNVLCPFYRAWSAMLDRCYSKVFQERFPSYIGCSVSDEWLTFSNFKAWMEGQSWKGKQLDKDLLVPGNKTYSPDTCFFVSPAVNGLLLDRGRARGDHPVGVYFNKRARRFQAQISLYGKKKNLGTFSSPNAAYISYLKAKVSYIREVAAAQSEPITSALYRHADILNVPVIDTIGE